MTCRSSLPKTTRLINSIIIQLIYDCAFPGATSYVTIWSTAECCLGIVAACLPTLRPVFHHLFAQRASSTFRKRVGSNYPFHSSSSTSDNIVLKCPQGKYVHHLRPLDDAKDRYVGKRMCSTSANGGPGNDIESLDGRHSIPMNAIQVHTSWENRRESV